MLIVISWILLFTCLIYTIVTRDENFILITGDGLKDATLTNVGLVQSQEFQEFDVNSDTRVFIDAHGRFRI